MAAIKSQPSAQKAFTLLEIMVALAIVGVAMISLLSLGNRSVGVHDRIQRITQATLLAQQKMTESEFEAQQNGISKLSGQTGVFADPFAEYNWQIKVESTPLPTVQMVTVIVSWGDVGRNEAVDVTSFLF